MCLAELSHTMDTGVLPATARALDYFDGEHSLLKDPVAKYLVTSANIERFDHIASELFGFLPPPIRGLMKLGGWDARTYFKNVNLSFDVCSLELAEKATQVLCLGAGLDTKWARLPVQMYEVDFPDTINGREAKFKAVRELDEEVGAYFLGSSRVTLGIDVTDHEKMFKALEEKGLDFSKETTVILERVCPYIEQEATKILFEKLAEKLALGSIVLFDALNLAARDAMGDKLPEWSKLMHGWTNDVTAWAPETTWEYVTIIDEPNRLYNAGITFPGMSFLLQKPTMATFASKQPGINTFVVKLIAKPPSS